MTTPAAPAPTAFADRLRALGGPDALLAAHPDAAPPGGGVNAHMHLPPNFSAFASVADALDSAAAEGLTVLGASNYYEFSVYAALAAGATARGLFPLFGLEVICLLDDLVAAGVKINDPGNPGKMYVCGKGIAADGSGPLSAEAETLLAAIRDGDGRRMEAVADALAHHLLSAGLPTGLSAAHIRRHLAARYGVPEATVYLQERHLAQAFQEAVFAARPDPAERSDLLARAYGAPPKAAPDDPAGVQNDIRSFLMKAGKPAFVPDTFVGFDHAYRLILALGGIPCYPVLADGASPVCPYEADPDALVADLTARGIFAAELIPVRNDIDTLARYVRTLRGAGLLVTAGTEHNTPDRIPLTPTAKGGVPLPPDIDAAFREGACVVAAHQYRRALGLPGYVDETGRPDPSYPDAGSRIAAYARLGAAVIAALRSAS